MTSKGKIKLLLLILICLGTVGGYVLANGALRDCTRDTVDELRMEGITGVNPDGTRVPAEQIPVSASVVFPFVVDVSYYIPNDVRIVRRRNRYFVLPGYTIKEPLPVGHTI